MHEQELSASSTLQKMFSLPSSASQERNSDPENTDDQYDNDLENCLSNE